MTSSSSEGLLTFPFYDERFLFNEAEPSRVFRIGIVYWLTPGVDEEIPPADAVEVEDVTDQFVE